MKILALANLNRYATSFTFKSIAGLPSESAETFAPDITDLSINLLSLLSLNVNSPVTVI